MLRSDQYEHQRKIFTRYELEGEPVVITEKMITTHYRGKDWPTRQIRWTGVHKIRYGDEEYLADGSVVSDSGPKLGVTVVKERHREVPFTPEERAAGRERINRVMREIFGCDVIWPEEGGNTTPCGNE